MSTRAFVQACDALARQYAAILSLYNSQENLTTTFQINKLKQPLIDLLILGKHYHHTNIDDKTRYNLASIYANDYFDRAVNENAISSKTD